MLSFKPIKAMLISKTFFTDTAIFKMSTKQHRKQKAIKLAFSYFNLFVFYTKIHIILKIFQGRKMLT